MRRHAMAVAFLAIAHGVADPGDGVIPRALPVSPLKLDPLPPNREGERILSGSGQFSLSGGNRVPRAPLAIEAESVRTWFHQLLGLPQVPVTLPIEIILYGAPGSVPQLKPIAFEMRFTDESFLLRLHVDLARGLNHERFERAIVSGLILQMSLGNVAPGEQSTPVSVPVWLVEGMREAHEWRIGQGDRTLYTGVFQQGGWFGVDELLAMDPDSFDRLDGASRQAFRVLSGALLMALLEQPNGREGLVALLKEVARFEGEAPILLREHFPELNLSEKSLVKWWALTLANLADAPMNEVMDIRSTEESLAASMIVIHRDEAGTNERRPIEEWRSLGGLSEEQRMAAIMPARRGLERLSFRCFPSYRPLLRDYHEVLSDWARGEQTDTFDERLRTLGETRIRMLERATRGRDYLDFVEISGATGLSGDFESYLQLKRELEERPRVPRKDPIARYLDTFEEIYKVRERR